MQIIFAENFKKKFIKLPQKIQNRFAERIGIFIKDPTSQLLKAHPLKGNMIGLRAFSITGNYRAIYKLTDRNCVKLIDIGTHSQLYR